MKYNVKCPYCKKPAKLVSGEVVYPHRPDLAGKMFYLCQPCDAFVGVHKNSNNMPLGFPANKELRLARSAVHHMIDPLWREMGVPRALVYEKLRNLLKLSEVQCHVAKFNLAACEHLIDPETEQTFYASFNF